MNVDFHSVKLVSLSARRGWCFSDRSISHRNVVSCIGLSHAVKFTPEGETIGLEVMGDVERQIIHFTTWDTGIGIAPTGEVLGGD